MAPNTGRITREGMVIVGGLQRRYFTGEIKLKLGLGGNVERECVHGKISIYSQEELGLNLASITCFLATHLWGQYSQSS